MITSETRGATEGRLKANRKIAGRDWNFAKRPSSTGSGSPTHPPGYNPAKLGTLFRRPVMGVLAITLAELQNVLPQMLESVLSLYRFGGLNESFGQTPGSP